MDFVSGFPRASSGQDAVWVIVDRLTKAKWGQGDLPRRYPFIFLPNTILHCTPFRFMHGTLPYLAVSDHKILRSLSLKFSGSVQTNRGLGALLSFS
jgi:hypothetical protein